MILYHCKIRQISAQYSVATWQTQQKIHSIGGVLGSLSAFLVFYDYYFNLLALYTG